MEYLNKQGDLLETAKMKSICVFNNWEEPKPKFGFVIPTYKRASLLRFAIGSILNQEKVRDYEILVADDNQERDDDTERMMKSEFCIDKIAYYKNSINLGQAGNWNKCFELSRAEWIIMLHDDDMLFPDFFVNLNRLIQLYEGENYGGFFPANISHSFENDELPVRKQQSMICRVIKLADFIQGNVIGTGALGMTLRREKVLEIGGVCCDCGPAVDYDFYNRFAKVSDIVKMYGYPLGVWRFLDNVSQKVSSVLSCVDRGDVLKMDTLESCGLNWYKPLFKHYIKGFDDQHIRNWYREMGKEIESSTLRPCSTFDTIVYKVFRIFFAVKRRMRKGCQKIVIK